MKKINKAIKRFLDIVMSTLGIIILLPLMMIISILIAVKIGLPIFFIQERPGLNGKIFKLIKFRTMTECKDNNGNLLLDEQRITNIGAILRRTSLDELPELLNILMGKMSLVGPRPLFIKYLPYYTDREHTRHKMRPGLTGLSQINGRNNLSWNERLELDVEYVENFSIFLDIKIIFITLYQVIKQKDALVVSSVVMPDFDDFRKNNPLI